MKKVLLVHGIGGKSATKSKWGPDWEAEIIAATGEELEFDYLLYDDLFEKAKERTDGVEYKKALYKLIKSWIITPSDSEKSKIFGFNIDEYAGMVAQFTVDFKLVNDVHKILEEKLKTFEPDIIFAHSLGSLICYDYYLKQTALGIEHPINLVTAGSQIMHPALRQRFGGVINPINVNLWLNLNNVNDRVFAGRPIKLSASNFEQISTPFSQGLFSINHEALEYIGHQAAVDFGWPKVLNLKNKIKTRNFKLNTLNGIPNIKIKAESITKRKALLIGINNYPNAQDRLDGCINDVYRMSEVLQESGFLPEEIRIVLDERATSKGIKERVNWLLKDAVDGDIRFMYYSGHGAQIPVESEAFEYDGNDETLVPYDFNWTREYAFTDKDFVELYSQLSHGVKFTAMFDCCHSGGISRDGAHKARGMNAPDDIRHRTIKWDAKREMWIDRKLPLASENLFKKGTKNKEQYLGSNLDTIKLGRAISLWSEVSKFENYKKEYVNNGPFIPTILMACQESELAYEYRHGVTSFGAFTYAFTTIMRQLQKNKKVDFNELITLTSKILKDLNYKQVPTIFPESRAQNQVSFI